MEPKTENIITWLFWGTIIAGAIWYWGPSLGSSSATPTQPQTVQSQKTLYDPPAIQHTQQLEFMGNPCTEDCSGHEAGYSWAEEKGIDDPDDCGGNSQSFIEGCQSYAEENASADDSDL